MSAGKDRYTLRQFAEALLDELVKRGCADTTITDEIERRKLINRALERYFQGRGLAAKRNR